MSEITLDASGKTARNKAYRHALRLGWMLFISALLALLIPVNSDFLIAVSMGYSLGAFMGWAILRCAIEAGNG